MCAALVAVRPDDCNAIKAGLQAWQLPQLLRACRCNPHAPIYAAGYSLGALLLAKYLAEEAQGKLPPLHGPKPLSAPLPVLPDVAPVHMSSDSAAGHSPDSNQALSQSPDATWSTVVQNGASSGAGTPTAQGSTADRQHGAAARLTAAAIVSSPFDMMAAAQKIAKPWTVPWLYNLVLTFRCAPILCTSSLNSRALASSMRCSDNRPQQFLPGSCAWPVRLLQ
jgi:predicted alpha/beta-fold hydrolase